MDLTDLLSADLEAPTLRNQPIPPILQVCTALRFYATGSFQSVCADISEISQPSVSRIITRVTQSIIRVFIPRYIKFPSNRESCSWCTARILWDIRFPWHCRCSRWNPFVYQAIQCTFCCFKFRNSKKHYYILTVQYFFELMFPYRSAAARNSFWDSDQASENQESWYWWCISVVGTKKSMKVAVTKTTKAHPKVPSHRQWRWST